MSNTMSILTEVAAERVHDEHHISDFAYLIKYRAQEMNEFGMVVKSNDDARQLFKEIAALAVAAMELIDRIES